MVKGISKQVIVVQAPDAKLFEQAIFILRSREHGYEGVTDEMLLKEANQIIHRYGNEKRRSLRMWGPAWACFGAAATGIAWLISVLI